MRGDDKQLQSGMFSYVSLEERVPQDHPWRTIPELVDQMPTDFLMSVDVALQVLPTITQTSNGGCPTLHGAYERDSKGTDTEMANWVQTAHPLAYYWYLD
jgi:hypothetical protein